MSFKNIKSLLEEVFTCPICLEILKDPATTKCGHSFCLDCVKKNKYECAVCRTKLEATFNTNYLVKKAIESLENMSEEEINKKYPRGNTLAMSPNKIKKNDVPQTEMKAKRINITAGYTSSNRENFLTKSENVNKYRMKRLRSQIDCFNEIDSYYMNNLKQMDCLNYSNSSFGDYEGQMLECNRNLFNNNCNKPGINRTAQVDFKFLLPDNIPPVNKLTSDVIDNFLNGLLVEFQSGSSRLINDRRQTSNMTNLGGSNISFYNSQNIPTPIHNYVDGVDTTYNQHSDHEMNIVNMEQSDSNKLNFGICEVPSKRFKYT